MAVTASPLDHPIAGRQYSQQTWTYFKDGHIEQKIIYTDGAPDYDFAPVQTGAPQKDDDKHVEWVWDGAWDETVHQKY